MAAPVDTLPRLLVLSRDIPELTHTFTFLTGAMYALREATSQGYRDRADYSETDRANHLSRLHNVIASLSAGSSLEPVWLAGFYYNAAIMRIDACYERFLKAMLQAAGAKPAKGKSHRSKTHAWAGQLEQLLSLHPAIPRHHLEWARTEVNKLKHGLYGRVPDNMVGQPIDVPNAEAAVSELVGLMERPDIRSRLAKRFSGLPPR
jgi:hypothetical protein